MTYNPNAKDAVNRIKGAANDARIAATEADTRHKTLKAAVDVVEGMRSLGADETTMAAFVDKVLAEAEEEGK